MNKDNKLQKIPEYSVEKIITKSDLATRGLQELGLLKNKPHFTIIYVCQFCGKLINFSSTPCIFCGRFPKTRREVVIAQALSSESMSIGDQLYASSLVKAGKDLELSIHNLREIIDRVTGDWQSHPTYHMLFAIADDMAQKEVLDERDKRRLTLTKSECLNCGKRIAFIHDRCEECGTQFSETQKLIVATKQILEFCESFLDDDGEDEESLEELIFVLVYTITRAVEKDEMPEEDLVEYIYELLHKTHYILARNQGVGVEIKNGDAGRIGGSDGDAKTKQDWISVLLAMNIDYLLHLKK